jgi:dienelactone hydrolase
VTRSRLLAILGLLGTVGLVAVLVRSPGSPAVELEEKEGGIVEWCAEGLEAIPGGGCLATPSAQSPPVPLVLYLHGIYDRGAPEDELDRQHRLAARATARGYAVLAVRGREGACHPNVPEYATRYCWPSNEEVADRAGIFVDGWHVAMAVTEARVGKGPLYVLGFSNGGYFAGLLAVRGLLPADAFVVAGAGPVEPVKARGPKPPLLLLSADEDVSQEDMMRLDDELTLDRWPHEHVARAGGHALTDWDIDAALEFFTHVRGAPGTLPRLAIGHKPRPRDLDAEPTHDGAPEPVREPESEAPAAAQPHPQQHELDAAPPRSSETEP